MSKCHRIRSMLRKGGHEKCAQVFAENADVGTDIEEHITLKQIWEKLEKIDLAVQQLSSSKHAAMSATEAGDARRLGRLEAQCQEEKETDDFAKAVEKQMFARGKVEKWFFERIRILSGSVAAQSSYIRMLCAWRHA